ncbi:MAG: zinc ribbon domain-containing protein [Saccharofermentans sp.]|nr:zinc ribbon domain-containing protein [Saccharofermentans sp.]
MNCPNCGKEYGIGASFCPECGTTLPAYDSAADIAGEAVDKAEDAGSAAAEAVAVSAAPSGSSEGAKKSNILPFDEFFKTLINAAIKPFSATAVEAEKYDSMANAAILAAIVCVILSIVRAVTRTITGGILGFLSGLYTVNSIIGSIVMFAVLTFGLAGVYFVAGKVIHEDYSFPRLLAIASMAVAPNYLIKVLIVPFMSLIWGNLGSAVSVMATAYFVLMLYEGTRKELKVEGDKRVILNAVCIGIAMFISYLF